MTRSADSRYSPFLQQLSFDFFSRIFQVEMAIPRWVPFFRQYDSEAYLKRTQEPYRPPTVRFHDIQAAVPKRLFERPLITGLWHWLRDYLVIAALIYSATNFEWISDGFAALVTGKSGGTLYTAAKYTVKTPLWLWCWWWMGLQGCGIWFNGHECTHGTLTEYNWVNDSVGLFIHMSILNPFFAWKVSHKAHHKGSAHMEREDNYVPVTRSVYMKEHPEVVHKLNKSTSPDHRVAEQQRDVREMTRGSRNELILDALEDVPVYLLVMRFVALLTFGWNGYVWFNVNGNRIYRPGSNHYDPRTPLFKPDFAPFVILGDVAVASMLYVIYDLTTIFGGWNMFIYWWIPYFAANFTLTWVTVLQHMDPTVPHFRGSDWTYFKGALATIDRPFYGWQGEFFIHGAPCHHVAHHLFPEMPFYNLAEATEYFKPLLGDQYNFDDSPPLYALWRAYHTCQFVEDAGGTLFYRDRIGDAMRGMASDLVEGQDKIIPSTPPIPGSDWKPKSA